MDQIITSNMEDFKKQLNGDKSVFKTIDQPKQNNVVKVQKNIILSIPSDYSGCGFIRNHIPMAYLNAVFGKSQKLQTIVMPFFCTQTDILIKTKSYFLQRVMNPVQVPMVAKYKENQAKFRYKLIYDIDDFIWEGPEEGEAIPEYNFGGSTLGDGIREASVKIMNMCDRVCVSSEFLKYYLKDRLHVTPEVVVIPNAIPIFFWGNNKKKEIKEKIKKPKILWTASPTHWHEQKKLKGDMNNAWCEYINKGVRDNKIDFVMMSGEKAPFFFKNLQNKSNFKTITWHDSYQYHLPVKEVAADISIGPLVPNFFNYSKSCIKMQEAYASGSMFIGTTFTNKYVSPYDEGLLTQPDNCSLEDIRDMVDEYTEPEKYNEVIKKQYQMMEDKGWYLESPKNINRFLKALV